MDVRLSQGSHEFAGRARPVIASPPALYWPGNLDAKTVTAAVGALSTYPYYLVLRGLPPDKARETTESLLRTISGTQRLSFTRVRIDRDRARQQDGVTRYSRTHLPLPLHTDSAYSGRPHSLAAFLMVRPDSEGGGRSIVVPAEDVLAALDGETKAALRAPVFAFGSKDRNILWGRPGQESMRYYRAQIDTALRLRETEMCDQRHLLDMIDRRLAKLEKNSAFALQEGDLLLLNNHKVLHGRTGFDPDSDRLMLRFRAHATCIE